MNPDPTENDHNLIESLLTHNFLCRLRPENVECLKNPTVAEFRTALKALKKRVQQDGFLVVYLSTHIIRIASSGAKVPIQKSKKKEDTYIALHDSMWGNPVDMVESCVPLSEFIDQLNNMKVDSKTILLHYAHLPRPSMVIPGAKTLYPPSDALIRLALDCNCPVMASCAVGSKASDLIKHSPIELYPTYTSPAQKPPQERGGDEGGTQPVKSENKAKLYDDMYAKFLSDWEIEPEKELVVSTRPTPPSAKWRRGEESQLKITMPTDNELSEYSSSLLYWRLARLFGAPMNGLKRRIRANKKRNFLAPFQHSAADPSSNKGSRSFGGMMSSMSWKSSGPTAASVGPVTVPTQSPVLVVPPASAKQVFNPVFFRCGPPCAPERPWWQMPVFDGVAASKFKVFMKNVSRAYNKWQEVHYPGDIKKMTFLVRNLPSGIPCQFKVCAYNNGGWGELSAESNQVTPGEDLGPTPDAQRWLRIREGGVLAALDQLDAHPQHRYDTIKGLKLVSSIGHTQNGFKNSAIAIRVMRTSLKACTTYIQSDPEIVLLNPSVEDEEDDDDDDEEEGGNGKDDDDDDDDDEEDEEEEKKDDDKGDGMKTSNANSNNKIAIKKKEGKTDS
eukprot:gene30135-39332_t